MPDRQLTLDQDPAVALTALLALSKERPVVVFKKSPTCPISHRAEWEFKSWLKKLAPDAPVRTAVIDVLAERPLARGLTEALDVQHESPQALWFEGGALKWHGSHGTLTEARFAELTAEHARRG
jgi:bacillithiol system protein YtxJ